MRLSEYVTGPDGKLIRGLIAKLVRVSGLSYPTVQRVARDRLSLKDYGRARALSEATNGAVSIAELCEPAPSADSSGPHEQQTAEPDAAE